MNKITEKSIKDNKIIKVKLKELNDFTGLKLKADDYFTGIKIHKGKKYFNAEWNNPKSRDESINVIRKLEKAVKFKIISHVETCGIKRISIFIN
jgi:hypothetical protein